MKTSFCAIGLSILLTAAARADLKWEQKNIELHPSATDKQAIAHFKYENVGKTPVRFKSVHASCGCTTTQTQHDVVDPGQKGEVTATFNIGGRTGTQVKQVTVQTDEPNAGMTMLTLTAVIPQMLSINPTFVFWKGGEEPKPKTISLKAGADFPIKNIKVTTSNPDFTTSVTSGGTGEWKLTVQPKSTDKAEAGMLTIQPEMPGHQAPPYFANVSVTATPLPAGAASASPPARPSPSAK